MKLQHATGTLGLAALALFAAPAALAQSGGWYGGASIGRTAATIDDDGIASGLAGQGLVMTSIEDRDRDTGYMLFGGYQFTPHIGVEAGFFDLGRFGYSATTLPLGTRDGNMRARGMNLDLVGTVPLVGKLSALGRVGVTSIRAKDSFSATGAASVPYGNPNPSERSTNLKVGVGLAYAFSEALSLRGEIERYRLKDGVGNRGHVDMASVGLVYRFGAKAQPVRASYVAPAPVYVAPAPAPMIAPAPAPAPIPVVAPPPAPAPAPMAAPEPRPAKPYRN